MIKKQYYCALLLGCAVLCGLAQLSGAAAGFRLERVIQAVQQLYGGSAASAASDWDAALTLFQGGTEPQKLRYVNEYFNRKLNFDDDQNVWRQADYWATPVEALMKGAGDCEDFAIAKYFSLKFSGVPVSRLRITYVKARISRADGNTIQAHMVLTYYPSPDAEPLVLDNLVNEIRPASQRDDLLPIFSFNSEGLWAAGDGKPLPGGWRRLSKWNDLLERMKSEGFE